MRVVIYSGLTYAEMPGYRPLLLDLHMPDDADIADNASMPVVVWIHGSGFVSGDRRYLPATMAPDSVFTALTGQAWPARRSTTAWPRRRAGRRSATTSPPRLASSAREQGSTAWTRPRHVGGVGRRTSGSDGRAD